jgi:dUTP pyrophosphatase
MKWINILKLKSEATLPTRAHPEDAGLDLYADEDVSFKPGQVFVVATNVAMEIEPGYVGLVRDRSSISKSGLKTTAGVVDAGYRGSLDVVFINLSGEHGCIKKGQKIAQLLLIPVATPVVREVTALSGTARGVKGFGSSGA